MAELSKQHWSAERYAATAHFVPAFGAPVVELLDPQPGERILDLGCGDGVLTEKIARLGATVVAVDAAPDMVAAAKARGLDARVVPGQSLAFEGEFDAVFSNAALHWMRPQEAVLDGVRRALKPGGRFVAEMGGHGDIASVIVALTAVLARRGIAAGPLNPFYFPTAEAHRAKLEQAGFTVEEIAILPRPTVLTSDIEPWLDAFCEAFLRGGAGTRPRHGAARHRRAVAPGLAGRGRALERRLRPAAVSRQIARVAVRSGNSATQRRRCALAPGSRAR